MSNSCGPNNNGLPKEKGCCGTRRNALKSLDVQQPKRITTGTKCCKENVPSVKTVGCCKSSDDKENFYRQGALRKSVSVSKKDTARKALTNNDCSSVLNPVLAKKTSIGNPATLKCSTVKTSTAKPTDVKPAAVKPTAVKTTSGRVSNVKTTTVKPITVKTTTEISKPLITARKSNLASVPEKIVKTNKLVRRSSSLTSSTVHDAYLKASTEVVTIKKPITDFTKIPLIDRINKNVSPIKPNILTPKNVLVYVPPRDTLYKNIALRTQTSMEKLYNQRERRPYTLDIYSLEVLEDIIGNLFQSQRLCVIPLTSIMSMNAELKRNRFALLNWLYSLQEITCSPSSCMFITARLVDCLLTQIKIPTNVFQLLYLTTYWIAQKVECDRPMVISQAVAFARNAFTNFNILRMERKLLKIYNFSLIIPDPVTFLQYYARVIRFEVTPFVQVAELILEIFLLSELSSVMLPSIQASAAFYLTIKIISPGELYKLWTKLMVKTKFCYAPNVLEPHVVTLSKELYRIITNKVETNPFKKFNENKCQICKLFLTKFIHQSSLGLI